MTATRDNELHAIELHDVDTLAITAGGERFLLPAVVRLEGRRLLVGDLALQGARYLPRQVHSRFYEELSLEGFGRPFPAAWRTSDLAHAHLEQLRAALAPSADDPILLLTGGIEEGRLPLLLGILQSLDLRVAAVAPSALLAAASQNVDRPEAVHLELYRHRAVATLLRRVGSSWAVEDERIDTGLSWSKLRLAQVESVARTFVRSTRYDPLASAQSEQQLYDRLPGWLEALERSERVDARLGHGGAVASLELERNDIAGVAQKVVQGLTTLLDSLRRRPHPPAPSSTTLVQKRERVGRTLLLGHHASALGVADSLRSAGHEVIELNAFDACRGALDHAETLLAAGPGLFVQRLGP